MKINRNLIPFGYKNKNNHIYTKDSFNWDDIISKTNLYGELKYPIEDEYLTISLDNASHIIKDIELYEDGLWGTIEVIDTSSGQKLKDLLMNGVMLRLGVEVLVKWIQTSCNIR